MWSAIWLPDLLLSLHTETNQRLVLRSFDQSETSIEIKQPIRDEYYLNTESSLLSIRLNLLAAMSDTLLWVCRLSSWTNQRSVLWPSDQSEASITWSRHQSSSSSVSTASRTLVPSSEVNKFHFIFLHAEYCQLFDISPLRHRNNSKMWLFWNYISDMMKYNLSCFQLLNFI